MKNLILYTCIILFHFFTIDSEAQLYAIKANRLIDGKSDSLHHDITIVIEDNKIKDSGKNIEIPANAKMIILADKTILPGLVDVHTHIMFDGSDDYGADIYKNSIPYRAIRAVFFVRKALWSGFTSMRDMCSEGTMYADVDIKKAIDKHIVPGPRLWVATRGLSIPGFYYPLGYSWDLDLPKGTQIVSGADECLRAVREQIANGADWIKVFADWDFHIDEDGGISGQTTFTEEELKVIVTEAHRLGHKVAAHAMSRDGIKAALIAGVNSIEHGAGFDEELIELAKANGVFWCPTLLPPEHMITQNESQFLTQILEIEHKALHIAYHKGLKIVLGTDAGAYPWSVNQAKEFEFLVNKAGFSPMDAIKAGTSIAAELLDQSDKIGYLAPGMYADIIAVPGDPLKDISVLQDVMFVMKDGEIFRQDK